MSDKSLFRQFVPENGSVIAEIACGHESSMERVDRFIDIVSKSETDLIKFQIFLTHERAKKGQKEWEIFQRLVFEEKDWLIIVGRCRDAGLRVLADVYGYESFELAKSLDVDGYKIHSEDLLNSFFIKDVLEAKKVTLIGIGGSKRKELYELLEFITSTHENPPIVLMPGIQTFPTPLEAHSIQEIGELVGKYSDRYNVKVGFADHIDGRSEDAFLLPLMALARGAGVIEKHLTSNRQEKWIDYQSALDAESFIKFVSSVKRLSPLLADVGEVTEAESAYRKMFKKTPFALRTIEAGSSITPNDIGFIKDVEAAMPLSSLELADKKTSRRVTAGQSISLEDVELKVGAIIVARMSSQRMPGKAMRTINGRESIRRVIDRVKKVRSIQDIVLATSDCHEDDVLATVADEESIYCYRGSLDDVADRYLGAASHFNFDHFLRVTGDAILCDNKMADVAIKEHLQQGSDITFMVNVPFGTAKEIVSTSALRTIVANCERPENTEYLEYYMSNERVFNVGYVRAGYVFDKNLRITLDYEEDLEFFEHIFRDVAGDNRAFDVEDVIAYLESNPEVAKINSHMTQKFQAGEIDTRFVI